MDRRVDPLASKVIGTLVAGLTLIAVGVIALLPRHYSAAIVGVMGACVSMFLWATASLGKRIDERRYTDGKE